jgi:hypothetical protein
MIYALFRRISEIMEAEMDATILRFIRFTDNKQQLMVLGLETGEMCVLAAGIC